MSYSVWNPWHGCTRFSEGCAHCYVYRRDEAVGRDPSRVEKTAQFGLPLEKDRTGQYKMPAGSVVYACMTSDFFLEAADPWREEAWQMMRRRSDVRFIITTKRILQAKERLPADWGEGYPNVCICCTMENRRRAEERAPALLALPARHKRIICEPLLERIDLSPWLDASVERVTVGGESGYGARLCRFDDVLFLREQCVQADVSFYFHQTGARFEKDGRVYRIRRVFQQEQARRADITFRSSRHGETL